MSRSTHTASPRRFFVALGTAAILTLGATSAEAQDITGERALLNRSTAAHTPGASNAIPVDGAIALRGSTASKHTDSKNEIAGAARAMDGAVALLGRRVVRPESRTSSR